MFEFDWFSLNRPLSPTSDADPNDVLAAKSAFRKLGYYEMPSYGLTPYPDQGLFDGIRTYQKDKSLTVDGYMLPGGETEQSVKSSLASGTMNEAKSDDDSAACAEPALWPWNRRPDHCPLPREKSGRPNASAKP